MIRIDRPLFAEEKIINEEQSSIQQILSQFKQPIPSNYIKLKVEEGNYQFSTSSKWKDKPNYERYGFYLEEKEEEWVQIDIPHNLLEELEIVKGDDITYPLYLTIDISQKKLIRGAYTIENEEEVFIDKPVSEKNVEKELVKRLKELEILRKQVKDLEGLQQEKVGLEEKVNNLEETIQEKDEEISEKERQVNHWEDLIYEETQKKEKLEKELKEIKSKKRDWRSFYEWLNNNVCDLNEVGAHKGNIKAMERHKYPEISIGQNYYALSYLMLSLENLLRMSFRNYGTGLNSNVKIDFLGEYNENIDFEKISQDTTKNPNNVFLRESNVRKAYNRLLENWREDTPLQVYTE